MLPGLSVLIILKEENATDLFGNDPLGSSRTVCTMISLDHVKDILGMVGNEFSRSIRKRNRILLQLFSKLWYCENPARLAVLLLCMLELTYRSVFPEIPINPSGHILAVRDEACSRVS
jgi:hypothetical protein